MLKTLPLITLVLGLAASIVHADPTRIALANLTGAERYNAQMSAIRDLDAVLGENTYRILPYHSRLKFHVDSPIGDIWVRMSDFRGSFSIFHNREHDNLAAIEVNAGSLDTDRGLIGLMLRSEGFLDVDNFPSMHFTGRDFEWYGERYAVLKGYMTIRNVTRQVAFYVELVDSEIDELESEGSKHIALKASTTIKRSEFGIDTLIPLVSDNVNLYIEIEAVRMSDPFSIAER